MRLVFICDLTICKGAEESLRFTREDISDCVPHRKDRKEIYTDGPSLVIQEITYSHFTTTAKIYLGQIYEDREMYTEWRQRFAKGGWKCESMLPAPRA